MKRTLPFLLAALIFSACASPSTNREATTTGTNANKPAETAATAPLTEADAVAKEKELWQQIAKQNMDAFGAALAEDQIYVSDDGVHDKASTIKSVTGFVPSDVTFSDWKFISAAKDVAVTTYKTVVKGTMNGQPLTGGASYASSVWVNRGGKWLAIFHQDSQIVQPPPAPAAKAAPKPSASPSASKAAASTPASTSADAEANEKAVWAALNAKKFDVFESFLAPDSIEVEAMGVYDRAASVKEAQQFDFSKSSLSDWKTVKVSNDASIVTYVAHFPGQKPDTEYHSTLWVNRDGKWLAVLHHGTPKAPPRPAATATKSPALKK